MAEAEAGQVRRRRVFYIPGYDPIHPRRYRELYRKEGAAQAEISGYGLELRPKAPGTGAYGWHVTGAIEGAEVEAEVEVLVWSDIVRQSMPGSIGATYLQMVKTAWIYISTGTLRRLMWMRKGPVIAALFPVGALILEALLAFAAGWILGALAAWGARAIWVPLGPFVFWPVLLVVGLLVLRWFKSKDGKIYAYYLMHDYAHSAGLRGAYPPELEVRMAEFRARIAAALEDDVDEVLVVGHSSGSYLAVTILADLIRAGVPAGGPALSFLSLGQVVPMVSFLPRAWRLRADLAYLSTRPELFWLDVTAPGDGCAFALCDPVAVSGVAPEGQRWPLAISAAFTQTLSPERWAELRWRFFRLHFQYLCAFDRPGDYDYFRITAGPQTLAARYTGRAPSKSRIDVPASKYTSVAP
ncbi:hypothetical protein [Pseudoroseicyclus sp. CXY001]|uniref:hypothetical protein n=1 Tax=Pseudoroseicyclus sp. CXY001 TaxID=3242492 RepID=UPI00358DA1FB